MNVVLPPDLEHYVKSLVQTGRYGQSNDVIEEALRQHRVGQGGIEVVMTPELEKLLEEGMEDLHDTMTSDDLRHRMQ